MSQNDDARPAREWRRPRSELILPLAARENGGIADGVAGSHVSPYDPPASRDLGEFEVVAAPDGEHRRRVAVVGRRPFHLGNDVYLPVRPLAVYDDHEVAEPVVGPVERREDR